MLWGRPSKLLCDERDAAVNEPNCETHERAGKWREGPLQGPSKVFIEVIPVAMAQL